MMNRSKISRNKDTSEEPTKRRRLVKRLKKAEADIPKRVTNDTLHLHREAVIEKGKKFKYPFYHSRHRVVVLSTIIVAVTLVVFMLVSVIRLYKYRPNDGFTYAVTKLIPFPVAKTDGAWVKYSDYLFELRVTIYSMGHSANIDFKTPEGASMLSAYERNALDRAESFAYARHIARQKGIKVTATEVDNAVDEIKRKSLNVKSLDHAPDLSVFERTIKDEYNWSEQDLRKSVTDLLYVQKVRQILDSTANSKANQALKLLESAKSSKKNKQTFADIAKQFSDDKASANNGGSVGLISQDTDVSAKRTLAGNDQGVPQEVVDELFRLKEGQYSNIIKTPDAMYIVKNVRVSGDKRELAYIKFGYQEISFYINKLRAGGEVQEFIKMPSVDKSSQSRQPS